MKFRIPGTDTTIYLTRITTTVKGKEDEQHPGCTFDLSQLLLTVEEDTSTNPRVIGASAIGFAGRQPITKSADSAPDSQPENHTEPLPESADEGHSQQL